VKTAAAIEEGILALEVLDQTRLTGSGGSGSRENGKDDGEGHDGQQTELAERFRHTSLPVGGFGVTPKAESE
jgi:hypothetical protein